MKAGARWVVFSTALAASLIAPAAGGHAEEIRTLVLSFGGERGLGQSIASVFQLQLSSSLRKESTPHLDRAFGDGLVMWELDTSFVASHQSAERKAKQIDTTAQLVLWGSVRTIGRNVIATAYLTLPKYKDFRNNRPEEWSLVVKRGADSFRLRVDVPQRYYAFEPIRLASEFVQTYRAPDHLILQPSPRSKSIIGTLGDNWTFLQHDGEYSQVKVGDKIGWIHLPKLGHNKPEVIDFVAGVIRIYRADWRGAIDLLSAVAGNKNAPTSIKADALMYILHAKSEIGQDASTEVDQLRRLAPASQLAFQYIVMHGLSRCTTQPQECTDAYIARLQALLDRGRPLFPLDDGWYQTASQTVAAGRPDQLLAQRQYDDGASDTEIKVGNTNPYSGPASAFGVVGATIEAYFKMVNDTGGVNGRKINFISYDDGYASPKTVQMVRKLVEEDKVLFVFQTLGTPTNIAIHKYLNAKHVPQLFVASGAPNWGMPKTFPWTMGWQLDYATEAVIYAKHILATIKDPKIGVLMQDDDYGKSYFEGFKGGLGKDADKIVHLATYDVTDSAIDKQMRGLVSSGANTFFSITTPRFAVQAIKMAAELGWRPAHYLNSVSAAVVGKQAGFEASQGVITAQYIKDPADPQWASSVDMLEWNAFMDKYLPDRNRKDPYHAYGYAVSATLAEVLRRAGDTLTRANIMKQAGSLKNLEVPLLLPGIKINTSPVDFYPIQSARLAQLRGERFVFISDVISSETPSN